MRIGLLGTGPWAERVHAPVLAAHPGLEFAGVWGRRPEAAEALGAAHGVPAHHDLDKLLGEVDAVSIALPPSVQAGLAVRAAEAGCHLLLDKPVALTVPDARAVADAARRHGVASVVFFTVRFGGDQIPWIARQAELGGWFTGRSDWLGSVFAPGSGSPYAASPWRVEKGALWDVGPHALSVLLPVLGDATRVTAVAGPLDTVHLVLRHAAGASSTLALSLTAPVAGGGTGMEIRGEHGVAHLPERGEGPIAALHRALSALQSAAATGEPHACDAEFGLRVVEILAGAERSLASGGPVEV
ncbi:Gfo/Idh/MocA family protein [Streptomyces rubellomurinus]|uniref:Oxidoreductase n=2 Tax=Streptomyces TaxID=1883 RepID=A0A0F2TN58_STRR3|nr:Gfo/Idh/MocA family oxidoreductase [Streptomyces rubellomurinus]KJS56496.1 oxidoreductase [Streptomyces rubellomurinus subsp. indigoferus]KJS63730.1 oxidoreductase [Streptomyces rubellomurinus]